jgi:hypothetical protein
MTLSLPMTSSLLPILPKNVPKLVADRPADKLAAYPQTKILRRDCFDYKRYKK